MDFQHLAVADRHGPLAERVVIVGQRVTVRVQGGRYGQHAQVWRPSGDRDRRDGHQVLGRVVVHDRVTVAARKTGVTAVTTPALVRRQAARLDMRVHETAKRPGAGVREHAVVRRLVVVVLVPPAHRHRALETVILVLERRGQRVVVPFWFRVRWLQGCHVEMLEAIVHEESANTHTTVR